MTAKAAYKTVAGVLWLWGWILLLLRCPEESWEIIQEALCMFPKARRSGISAVFEYKKIKL